MINMGQSDGGTIKSVLAGGVDEWRTVTLGRSLCSTVPIKCYAGAFGSSNAFDENDENLCRSRMRGGFNGSDSSSWQNNNVPPSTVDDDS